MLAAQDPSPQVVEPPKQDHPIGNRAEVVTSRSEQFKISGGDALARGRAAILAEQAKDELLYLTGEVDKRKAGEVDKWKVSVNIVLHGKEGDPAPNKTIAARVVWIEGAPHLKLDKHLGPGLEPDEFKQAVTELLIYERSLEGLKGESTESLVLVPSWLSVGLCEASAWRLDESDRSMYAALFKKGGAFKLEELLQAKPTDYQRMDAATRAAFRVSSGALVMALLEQSEGQVSFRDFLKKVATYHGDMPILLRENFPDLNLSENSLAKWWALQLANKGGLNLLTDVLTIQETEEDLEKALSFDVPSPAGMQRKGLSAWSEVAVLKGDQRFAAVRPAQEALIHLSYRCFPSYRPMLLEYQKLLIGLSRGKTEGVPQMLGELKKSRDLMLGGAERARDYLDWFEITRARKTSGEFDDYLKLKERLKAEKKERTDGVSRYLDRMDELFDRSDEQASSAGRR